MDKREASTHTPLPVSVCLCCHLAAGGPRTHCPMSGRRVGFCLSDKKRRRMNLDAFADFCAAHGVEVVEIDLSQPLVPQGPFDVIVHKLSDVIVEAEHDSQSQKLLSNFQTYVSTHPSTVLLDPLPAMTQLLDRFASYRIMSKLHNSLRDWRICSPPYLEIHSASDLSSIQQAVMAQGLSFPLICKTRVAHGSLSHEMSLIFSAGSLADIHPPCVLQSFVNHGAVLHKVFVVGDKHFCVERPSLKNFPSGPCVLVSLCLQTGKPSSSTAIRCPSQSQALISQLWMNRCHASLLPAPRPWPPWSESSEFSWAWPCLAWTSSSTYTRTPSLSSTSTSSQGMRECPSFSPLCLATSSQCWTNRPLLAPGPLALLRQHRPQVVHLLPFKSPKEQSTDCAVPHQPPRTNKSHWHKLFLTVLLGPNSDFASILRSYLFVICNMA
ncbi:inositol-tetrakisphosphate 1-kinase-like isoform X2 [Trachinotus anak]|uniref:inositol-tetrakisphosphate 1-kinase-like isoform X2 n=1 Tax=Trachinotus anak TaxID=443729 RepID=UPI0039F19958